MKKLQDIIDKADAIIITAGAGVGVDSGLPDFRGSQGLWKEYPELKNRGLNFEQMAKPDWFRSDPKLAWAFYGHRLHQYMKVKPHAGFDILLDICHEKSDNYFVVTSNVDNHFQKAGFDPMKIHEVHGSLAYFQCVNTCNRYMRNNHSVWPADYTRVKVDEESFEATNMPTCPHCSGLARPNVLLFGDYDWIETRENRQKNNFDAWCRKQWDAKSHVLIIEVGAGKAIPTIRNMSEQFYLNKFYPPVDFIRINPRDYDVPEGAISIKAGGLEGIQSLF